MKLKFLLACIFMLLNFAIAGVNPTPTPPTNPTPRPPIPDFKTPICKQSCVASMSEVTFSVTQGSAEVCPNQPQLIHSCGGYGCDKNAKTCLMQCKEDNDCASGYHCDRFVSQCVSVTYYCTDKLTLMGTDGSSKSCAPYLCSMGTCQYHCNDTSECDYDHGMMCHDLGFCGPISN